MYRGSSAHIRVFAGGREARERWDERTEQINSFGLIPIALSVFPIITLIYFSTSYLNYLVFFFFVTSCASVLIFPLYI